MKSAIDTSKKVMRVYLVALILFPFACTWLLNYGHSCSAIRMMVVMVPVYILSIFVFSFRDWRFGFSVKAKRAKEYHGFDIIPSSDEKYIRFEAVVRFVLGFAMMWFLVQIRFWEFWSLCG